MAENFVRNYYAVLKILKFL